MTTPSSLRIAARFAARDALAATRRPRDAVAAAHAAFEAAWAAARPGVAARSALACRPGCAACCHQPVAILPAEAAAITAAMAEAFDDETRHAVRARIAAAVGAPAGSPCPLLDDGGRCRVYAVRPLRCRGVHSRDAAACAKWTDPARAAPDTIPSAFPPEPLALADAALAGLGQALAEAGWPVASADLTASLAAAAENRPQPGPIPWNPR